MNEQKQQPVTLTERQAFQMILDTLRLGTYPGPHVVRAAEAMIFCERVVAASDPGVMTPTPTEAPADEPTQKKKAKK